jgi:hypothetical protein
VLTANIPPGLEFKEGNTVEAVIDTLGANATKMVRLNATAVETGQSVIEVQARVDVRDAAWVTVTGHATVMVQSPGLVVRLDAPRKATLGAEILLRAELANPGDQPVRGVGLLLTLPDGMEPLSASTGGTADAANRHLVGWSFATLAGGEHKVVTLKSAARGAGDSVCQAKASGQDVAETKATAAVRIDAGPSLGLEIAGRDDAIDSGVETVYEVHVVNRGGVPCAGVRLAAEVSDGLQVVQAEGATAAVIQQQRVPFDPLAELPGRTEALYRLHIRGLKAGEWRLRLMVDADVLTKPLQREVNVRVTAGGRQAPGAANPGAPQ